jgi:hypothetical protein
MKRKGNQGTVNIYIYISMHMVEHLGVDPSWIIIVIIKGCICRQGSINPCCYKLAKMICFFFTEENGRRGWWFPHHRGIDPHLEKIYIVQYE